MPLPAIPGFYFDTERNRYFRIVQSGEVAAAPAAAHPPSRHASRSQRRETPAVTRYTNSAIQKSRRDAQQLKRSAGVSAPNIPSSLTAGIAPPQGTSHLQSRLFEYLVHSRQGAPHKWAALQEQLQKDLQISGMRLQYKYDTPSEITALEFGPERSLVLIGQKNGIVR